MSSHPPWAQELTLSHTHISLRKGTWLSPTSLALRSAVWHGFSPRLIHRWDPFPAWPPSPCLPRLGRAYALDLLDRGHAHLAVFPSPFCHLSFNFVQSGFHWKNFTLFCSQLCHFVHCFIFFILTAGLQKRFSQIFLQQSFGFYFLHLGL